MIKWSIPDSARLRPVNFWILNLEQNNNELFIPDSKISAAYGIFRDTIWSGGRVTLSEQVLSMEEMRQILEQYKSFGVQYRMVFSQKKMLDEYLYDYWGNIQLKLLNEYNGAAIVASQKLAQYIKENYPNVELIASTTQMPSQDQFLHNLSQDFYSCCVLNTVYNFDYDFIPKEYRNKVEILLNDCCPPLCAYRLTCYGDSAAKNLGMIKYSDCKNRLKQNVLGQYEDDYTAIQKGRDFLKHYTPKDVIKAASEGVEWFKLSGRELTKANNILEYCYYMIKPEYEKDTELLGLFSVQLVKNEFFEGK